jgi:homeobox protein cut-like
MLQFKCGEMREAKAASIAGRKKLNEVTKFFRSKPIDEQTNSIADILKLYQEEIDQLSRRAKSSEICFLSLYKSLNECPDPVPVFEHLMNSIASLSTHELEIERLHNELKQYDQEFQLLKNQDITIRQLEDKILEYQENIEEKVNDEVKKQMQEFEENCERKINDIRDNQKATEKRLAAAIEASNLSQANAEKAQCQLFELSSSVEKRISDMQVENSLVSEMLERSKRRIEELENDLNHSKNNTFQSPNKNIFPNNATDEEDEETIQEQITTLNDLVRDLRMELVHKEETVATERRKYDEMSRKYVKEADGLRVELENIKKELNSRPAVEQLLDAERQLRVLRKVLFNIHDDDSDNDNDFNSVRSVGEDKGLSAHDKGAMRIEVSDVVVISVYLPIYITLHMY